MKNRLYATSIDDIITDNSLEPGEEIAPEEFVESRKYEVRYIDKRKDGNIDVCFRGLTQVFDARDFVFEDENGNSVNLQDSIGDYM